ncbi:kinase-like domain-containing protein [Xylariaceae sp. AK1471]|nr:kinase-like domain-containing protein [Xylariaceae sp. AK1471]
MADPNRPVASSHETLIGADSSKIVQLLHSRRVSEQKINQILQDDIITDIWLPITPRIFSLLLKPTQYEPSKSQLWAMQEPFLTNPLMIGDECNWPHDHVNLASTSHDNHGIAKSLEYAGPLRNKAHSGSFLHSTVIKVKLIESENNYSSHYALKKFHRRDASLSEAQGDMRYIIGEIRALRKIRHDHFIRLVTSYTTREHIGIIMSPVADCDLGIFLQHFISNNDPHPPHEKENALAGFFGCLATALMCLHFKYRIRHKDIKPQNILVRGNNVLLTDFGIALDWSERDGETTETEIRRDPVYCPPEFYSGKRGTKSDIWSLGCVFLEMFCVLRGLPYRHLLNNLKSESYWKVVDRIPEEITNLKHDISAWGVQPLHWIEMMLKPTREDRCNARELEEIVRGSKSPDGSIFFGHCCQLWNDANIIYEDHDELHPYQINPNDESAESAKKEAMIWNDRIQNMVTVNMSEGPWSSKHWISQDVVQRLAIAVEDAGTSEMIRLCGRDISSNKCTKILTWARKKNKETDDTPPTEDCHFMIGQLPKPYEMVIANPSIGPS